MSQPSWVRTSAHDPMPVREPLRFPLLSHAGDGRWHTLCRLTSCGALITGEQRGSESAKRAHEAHVNAVHDRYGLPQDALAHLGPRLLPADQAHRYLPVGRYPTLLKDRRYVVLWVEADKVVLSWPQKSGLVPLRP